MQVSRESYSRKASYAGEALISGEFTYSYGCPKSGDKWEQESLTDSLTAHTATGAGCWMRYTFQGAANFCLFESEGCSSHALLARRLGASV